MMSTLKTRAATALGVHRPRLSVENAVRAVLGVGGVALVYYGCLRMLQQQRSAVPYVVKWLIGAVIIHDGIIAPITVAIGWLISRYTPGRVRAYVQSALVSIALVCSVALILIRRQHKYSAASLGLLRQNYLLNTAILIAVIVVATGLAYWASAYFRPEYRSRPAPDSSRTNTLPPEDH